MTLYVGCERGEIAGRRPGREGVIAPEVFEDAHEVGLTASEKTTDPDGRLFVLREVGEKLLKDALQAALVLALADKAA